MWSDEIQWHRNLGVKGRKFDVESITEMLPNQMTDVLKLATVTDDVKNRSNDFLQQSHPSIIAGGDMFQKQNSASRFQRFVGIIQDNVNCIDGTKNMRHDNSIGVRIVFVYIDIFTFQPNDFEGEIKRSRFFFFL